MTAPHEPCGAAPATEGIKYAGSKLRLLPYILEMANRTDARTVLDGFSGSTRVSQALAKSGYRVISNDVAGWSEVLATCYLLNRKPSSHYAALIEHLNAVRPRDGWFTAHYGGAPNGGLSVQPDGLKKPWQIHNTRKLDGIREEIEALDLSSTERALPAGWRQGTLHDVAALNPESWSAKRRPDVLSYVDLTNTKWGYVENVETCRWDEAPSRARRVLRRGDTIMATVRPGNGSFALVGEEGLTGSTGFAVLRPRAAADRALVWCAVTVSDNLDRLAWLADGAAYPAVRPAVVAATPVTLADPATRAEFASLVDPLLDKVESNKRDSRRLRVLRDELQARLLSGKLQLGEDYR